MASKGSVNPVVFFEIKIGAMEAGRIQMELFSDVVPKTAENFRQLCTGGYCIDGKVVSYKDCLFHRILKDVLIQGGDVINNDGSGLVSIYGGTFGDENFTLSHKEAGLLSMVNTGRNTNGCQFFITSAPCPYLDGKNVVFGKVVEGDMVLKKIQNVPVNSNNCPLLNVSIFECGEVEMEDDE